MQSETLEKVLLCPDLPSLPAVAVRVLDLTSDPDVNMAELASTVQNDQALAAKILRTVNSSIYGLRERCTTIQKALVLLGLSPVKSLVLGFSLVQSTRGKESDDFDYVTHWRRALYSGLAARLIAEQINPKVADEAFLAALLQDVGLIAMYRALGRSYLTVVAETGGDHSKLSQCELSKFEIHHGDVGAMLCEKWNLPEELTIPVKYHERPTAAPQGQIELVRLVAAGGLVHDALTDAEPTDALRSVYARTKQWFGLSNSQADAIVKGCAEGAGEMSKLFDLETGSSVNADQIIESAGVRLLEMAKSGEASNYAASKLEELMTDGAHGDPLTGAVGRGGFDKAVRGAFREVEERGCSLALVQVVVDGIAEIADHADNAARDESIIGIVALLQKHFAPAGGVVCRLGEDVFSIVIPGFSPGDAVAACEAVRDEVPRAFKSWKLPAPDGLTPPRLSLGVAVRTRDNADAYPTPKQLVIGAAGAAQLARKTRDGAVQLAKPQVKAA